MATTPASFFSSPPVYAHHRRWFGSSFLSSSSPLSFCILSLLYLSTILSFVEIACGARLASMQNSNGITTTSTKQTEPCIAGEEMYLGNASVITCVEIRTGATRLYKNLALDKAPNASLSAHFSGVNDQLTYSGWAPNDTTFGQLLVDIDVSGGKTFVSGRLPMRGYVLDWNEILYNPIDGKFWCSYDENYHRLFYYFDSPTATPTFFFSGFLLVPDSGTAGSAPQSALDAKNLMYYSLLTSDQFDKSWIFSANLSNKKTMVSPKLKAFGLRSLSLNPTTQKLYGWLSWQEGQGDSFFLYNTTIVEIDPLSGSLSAKVVIDLPSNRTVNSRDPSIPYLLSFDWANGRVSGLFSEYENTTQTSSDYLKTFDLQTGKILYNVRVGYPWPANTYTYSWGLSYMNHY